MDILSQPFADFLNLTFPVDYYKPPSDALVSILQGIGGFWESSGVMRVGAAISRGKNGRVRTVGGGVVKFREIYGLGKISISGAVLGAMRQHNLLAEFVGDLWGSPFNITRLDVSVDAVQDGPVAVSKVRDLAFAGSVSLTRKVIQPRHCQEFRGPSVFDSRLTGTVYLGRATSDVRLVVYDKREERCKAGGSDPGPLTRYELRIGRHVGVGLSDIVDPTALFWHYMPREILAPAQEPPKWRMQDDSGFTVVRVPVSSSVRLRRLVESSYDVAQLIEMALSHDSGERMGLASLHQEIDARVQRVKRQLQVGGAA
jgi:hypothetical protein